MLVGASQGRDEKNDQSLLLCVCSQLAVARRSFRELDRDRSGFLSKKVFMDEMVRQAVISGMGAEDAAQLEVELEAEFRCVRGGVFRFLCCKEVFRLGGSLFVLNT